MSSTTSEVEPTRCRTHQLQPERCVRNASGGEFDPDGHCDSGTGNALDNVITGNNVANFSTGVAGNDFLNGGLGVDTMQGNAGNDTYVVDTAGDVVTELPGAGTDTIQSSVSLNLSTPSKVNVENLTLTALWPSA